MIQHYSRSSQHKRLQFRTSELWNDMVSPLCGILTCMYAYLRQTYDPRGIALGGQLTDPTLFKGMTEKMIYHIGGMGMNRDDAMIKCLAESYERYISVLYDPEKFLPCEMASYHDLLKKHPHDCIPAEREFHYFNPMQYSQKNFYAEFNSQRPMLWIKTQELTQSQQNIWLPAHLIFLGYVIKKELNERRLNGAVSTGTAVHTEITSCVYNSLLETVLIDAVIGHWYTSRQAYKIILDERTRHVANIMAKSMPLRNLDMEFYWIPSIDFSIFNVACVGRSDIVPKFCVGLGADSTLEAAMYKAFLEFLGTRSLSNSLVVLQENPIDPTHIQNLDDNVLFYALGHNEQRINDRFNPKITLKADDLPPDMMGGKQSVVAQILKTCAAKDKNIAFFNLTNPESRQLGLVATKTWSPQLLTLPLPNAVPMNHVRFSEYGGVTHCDPHPYP